MDHHGTFKYFICPDICFNLPMNIALFLLFVLYPIAREHLWDLGSDKLQSGHITEMKILQQFPQITKGACGRTDVGPVSDR